MVIVNSRKRIVLVEIALEATAPFGVRSGDGEPGEEFGERARRRGPFHLAEGFNQIFCGHVAPIHFDARNPRSQKQLCRCDEDEIARNPREKKKEDEDRCERWQNL